MKIKKLIWIGVIILVLIGIGFFVNYYIFSNSETADFKLDTVFLRIALNEGRSSSSVINIENIEDKPEHFTINLKGDEIRGLVSIADHEIDLASREVYALNLNFSGDSEPGVYLGELDITLNGEVRIVPIVLEIQSSNVLFGSNLNFFPQGREVLPGQSINADIKVFDLSNLGRSNVKLSYFVKSFDGRIIISESEDIIVDGKLDYSKSLTLPKNIRLGDYVFYAVLKYGDSVGTSSVVFSVVNQTSSGGVSNQIIYWIIGIFAFFFLIFIGLFIYSIFFRDRVIRDMENMYRKELRRQGELIECRKKKDLSRLSGDEKEVYKTEIEKIKRERLAALKNIHNGRIKEYTHIKKNLKKRGKKGELNQKLKLWKKKGYDTRVLEGKYKLPKVENIKKQINLWKKKGYDTRVLERK